jgi:hypothetical protein
MPRLIPICMASTISIPGDMTTRITNDVATPIAAPWLANPD